jgi:ATP-binding cassette subfamily B protein RaxB
VRLDLHLFGPRRLPFVAASELNECGLACLACISEYFDGSFSLTDIRYLAAHSGRGETLLELRDIAEHMGLAARGVRVGLDALALLATPAILHWDMNHFVVLERVTRMGILIMDPAAGRLQVSWSEVNQSFTGVALETKTSAHWRRRSEKLRRVSILDFVGPFGNWKNDIGVIVALSLLLEILVLVAPMQMRLSVDTALQSGDGRLVWVLGLGFCLVILLQASVSIVRAWAIAIFSTRVGYELKDRFVRSLHRKPARFFTTHHSADILSRSHSVDMIQHIVTAQLLQALMDLVMSIAIVVVIFISVPVLALVVSTFGLINLAATGGLRHAAMEVSRRCLRVEAVADSLFLENARAARAIRLFGKESARTSVWRNKFVELINLWLADERLILFSTQAAQLTTGLCNVALISIGTYLVLTKSITLGTMLMVFVFSTFLMERIDNCVNYAMELRRVQTHAERIDEIISGSEDTEPSTLRPFLLGPDQGVSVRMRNVWFRYGDASPWLLKGVNLTIQSGESVAIVGPSGSGKTTLMHLLVGLLEPTQGEILINDRDLRTITSSDYAKVVGAVMQDDMLFQGTVADNISFFDAPVDMARVVEVARRANIAHECEAMPMRYYSLLAEGATDISGGQKQRLFIARALYHAPKILFLDEATSHLDAESETLVNRAITAMEITRVLVAHREGTIAMADRVLEVDPRSGQIVERSRSEIGTGPTVLNGSKRQA